MSVQPHVVPSAPHLLRGVRIRFGDALSSWLVMQQPTMSPAVRRAGEALAAAVPDLIRQRDIAAFDAHALAWLRRALVAEVSSTRQLSVERALLASFLQWCRSHGLVADSQWL